ncbi:breast carcinoma-amplified sequence 4 isoform X2 [Symphalangus syndactylus]|uniref:breast carcinoma-amplified sequence 4 isoform X1 n=1 Tax=Symphalangus syndactylus TaxID=9590 RepID=UPI0024428FA3|nr:breast carcinoma-amplified sequence 4 isoform X1 [Symphalangus syndactylus]XP_055122259.1 breast carcinoma-amplified sequence 4 isoform X2 [Symphalangus syndactylus]
MQRTGGGAPRPGRYHGLPGSLRQPDPATLLMLLVDADRPEPVRSGARELALFLTPEAGAEAKEVEETIEGMLLRLEEFCSLADLIRSDTSQILEENIPVLKAKLTEMRGIYAKVDRLEAFVKMVGHHVAFLEADVLQAERDHGAFPQALRRWLGSAGLPSFRNKLPAPVPVTYELPTLYRTEDYFPVDAGEAQHHPRTCPRPL